MSVIYLMDYDSFHHSKLKNTVAIKAFHSLIERLAGSKSSFISNILELRNSYTTVGKTIRTIGPFRDKRFCVAGR